MYPLCVAVKALHDGKGAPAPAPAAAGAAAAAAGTLPVIGISCWRRHLPTLLGKRTELDTLHPAYVDRVAEAGGIPVILPRPPASTRVEIARDVLDVVDGLLFSGGGDMDPRVYGERNDSALEPDIEADEWELALVRAAAERRLPTLGICRGAQVMAVAFGGRLLQALPRDAAHGDILELSPEELLTDRHPVRLAPGSALLELFGGTEALPVNSIHHHAVEDAGTLAVTAVAAGGLIEGVEPAGELADWPALGVQWHPEKMHEPEQHRLFEQFVQTAAAWRATRAAPAGR